MAADLAVARSRLDMARAGRFGEIEYRHVVGIVNEARGDATFSPDDRRDVFDGLGPYTRLGLNIDVPIWSLGNLGAAFEAAERGIEAERARGEIERAEVILRTKRLYYGLLLSRQLHRLLGDMRKSMDEAVEKLEARLRDPEGGATERDLLQLKIGRARFARGVYEVETSSQLARKALARAVGLADAREFDVADRRLRPVEARVAPEEDYLARGIAERPEWRSLREGLAAQSARVELEEIGYYPLFYLSTGVQYGWAGNRDTQRNAFAYEAYNLIEPQFMLGFRWNLNFAMTGARVAAARAELSRLEAKEREAATGLLLEVQAAYAGYERARRTLDASDEGRKAGRALLFLAVSNFDLGLGEARELFESLGAYTESSSDHLRAVHDYNLAIAELGRAVGEELTGINY
ncbi:MAG: TolC family protein [Acidobacteria bacterium]|nr:TolC family protein [Acidobacteriota bacterium]